MLSRNKTVGFEPWRPTSAAELSRSLTVTTLRDVYWPGTRGGAGCCPEPECWWKFWAGLRNVPEVLEVCSLSGFLLSSVHLNLSHKGSGFSINLWPWWYTMLSDRWSHFHNQFQLIWNTAVILHSFEWTFEERNLWWRMIKVHLRWKQKIWFLQLQAWVCYAMTWFGRWMLLVFMSDVSLNVWLWSFQCHLYDCILMTDFFFSQSATSGLHFYHKIH